MTPLARTPLVSRAIHDRSAFSVLRLATKPKVDVLPYELVNGNRVGTTVRWNLAMEYRIARYVNLSISYFGRKEPARPRTQHLGKMEVRAFF